MNLKILFLLLMPLTISCGNTKKQVKSSNDQTQKEQKVVSKSNHENFYGFTYTTPKDWVKTLSDFKAVNLKGQVKTIETDYQINNSGKLRLIYHPGESGITLFNNYHNSRRKNLYQIDINKMPAVKLIEKINRDGKGHLLSQPMMRTKIFVLHPDKKGSLEIVFDMKSKNKQLLSDFKSFIKSLKPAK